MVCNGIGHVTMQVSNLSTPNYLHRTLRLVSKAWRLIGTALSFASFGIGGIVLWLLVFPCLCLLVGDPVRRKTWARNIIRYSFRGFIGLMSSLGVLRYRLDGLHRLKRGGLLILANHPSLIDTVFLMAFVENADCIVKAGLWGNPFTRGPVNAAAYIKNESGPELMDACIATLVAGNNLIIFPEGTRTPENGQIELKRGAANVAVRGVRDITPVVIHCEPQTLGKGVPWWQIPDRQVEFTISVKNDISVAQFIQDGSSEGIAARQLTEFLQQYFTREKGHHA